LAKNPGLRLYIRSVGFGPGGPFRRGGAGTTIRPSPGRLHSVVSRSSPPRRRAIRFVATGSPGSRTSPSGRPPIPRPRRVGPTRRPSLRGRSAAIAGSP